MWFVDYHSLIYYVENTCLISANNYVIYNNNYISDKHSYSDDTKFIEFTKFSKNSINFLQL